MTGPWDLPAGWRWARFDEVATIASNLVSPADYPNHPHLAPNHVVPESGRYEKLVSVAEDGVASNKHLFKPGQIIYSKIRPYLRKAVIAKTEGLCSADMYPIETELEPRYLMWWMLSGEFTKLALKGRSVIPKINQRELKALPVPVPPLEEQDAIVEAIERTLSKVDAATSSVLSGQARSTVLRGSALQLMLESAKSLANDLPLDAVWESANYGTSERCEFDGPGLPVLRIPNIRDRAVDFSEIKRVASPEGDVGSAVVTPDDVLIVRTNGSRSLIGRTAVVPATAEPFACASYLIRIRPTADLVRAGFLAAALEAPSTRERIESLAASSAGQYNLSVAKLRRLSIPTPSLAVQDQLLQELAQRESMVTHADAVLGRLTRRSAQLRRSVLKAAFEGRLTHDTTDAPLQDFEQVPA